MLLDPISLMSSNLHQAIDENMDLIRGDNPFAFTRKRKITPYELMLQMLDRQSLSQWGELMKFYDDIGKSKDVTEIGFYLAQKKFNLEAIRFMMNDYMSLYYDGCDESLLKFKDCFVMGIDGSKFTVPNTKENLSYFGTLNEDADNYPVQGMLSTLHDCLNGTKLDVLVVPCRSSEREFALKHIEYFHNHYIGKGIFTMDRGYSSMRLIDFIINKNQYFVIRAPKTFLSGYISEMKTGDDCIKEVTFDTKRTNEYRDDVTFRQHLMNTTYRLKFTKVGIVNKKSGEISEEILISNLPIDEFNIDDIIELYHKRRTTEISYNHLNNRMKMEEFSGYSTSLILQDIYTDCWLFNLFALKILKANIEKPIEQANEKYVIKRNINKAIGVMKSI